jgi:glycosyltransferase involved in cell wall biosynthesis
MKDKRILLVEICNYTDYPIGGYLSFAKQMLSSFDNQLLLVGLSTDETTVGEWSKKEINGIEYDYFSVMHSNFNSRKSLIPARLKSYLAVRKYRDKILSKGVDNVFIQTPEVLFALQKSKIKNICTRIPGVENPMRISRYWYGKYFASLYDFLFYKLVKKSSVIFASADTNAINKFIDDGKGVLSAEKVIQFPTRVNTEIFYPKNKENCRESLKLDKNDILITTTGRLNKLKGWEFMLDCFSEFNKIYNNSKFVFIGDGEDRSKIEKKIIDMKLDSQVFIAGRVNHDRLSQYLGASNLYIMGSYIEGWATSLVEAIASGIPVCVTDFSSASELVENGLNGYVVKEHNKEEFVKSMIDCLNFSKNDLEQKSLSLESMSVSNLKSSILKHWRLI